MYFSSRIKVEQLHHAGDQGKHAVEQPSRWRYFDPFLKRHIDRSHLMTSGEALGLDPKASLIPGSALSGHELLRAGPRWR